MSAYFPKALFIACLFLISCGRRTPSDTRFEKACDIPLPEGTVVLKDQYVEAGKEFGLRYNLQLTDEGVKQFATDIRKSKNFSPVQEVSNKWMQKGNGYFIYLATDNIYREIEVDTVNGVIYYKEEG